MRGLTPTMHRAFWPSSTYRKRKLGREKVSGNKRKRAAARNGQLTDLSLERLIRGELHLHINREAWMIKQHLDRRGVRMTGTQVKVWNFPARVGTDLDLVGEKDGKVVIFEIKSGFRGYLHAHSGCNMSVPFTDWDDSVCNQHALQLAFGVDMYRKCHPDHEVDLDESCVLVVNDEVQVFTLRQLEESTLRTAWRAMHMSRKENKAKRETFVKKQCKKRGRTEAFTVPEVKPIHPEVVKLMMRKRRRACDETPEPSPHTHESNPP